ncbi:MAG TPA: molybdopterin cofactor-binding domain-containing protein [Steroidobacteraceae bacterium]|nr:molybdopterin cofactor-binding domain-containing protein [Steroidobacteraceae bacterium]
MGVSRRQFLQISAISGGGLLATLAVPAVSRVSIGGAAAEPVSLGAFIRIDPDNSIVIGARGCEIGQGVRTSLPMLIAEELDVRWDRVRVEQLPYGIAPGAKPGEFTGRFGPQGAGGSTSISDGWSDLRQAGAQVRALLVAAAAQTWGAVPGSLTARDGEILHPDGRTLTYGELAGRAASLPIPAGPFDLKQPRDFRILGKPARVADAADIVSGRARYGIDATMPGMLYAVIARSPTFDGRLESFDDTAARKVRGVRDVVAIAPPADGDFNRNLAAGVAVIADNTWAALQGRKALKIQWDAGPWAKASSREMETRAQALANGSGDFQSGRADGDTAKAWSEADHRIEATYQVPFLAHATMEPPGATIAIDGDKVKLIASLQSPGGASRMIAAMLGISRLNIDIELPRAGGGFGRRLENDFVAEAVMIAQRIKRPVKVTWTRDDDLANDFFRPFGVQRLRASADAHGNITGWQHRVAATSRKWRAGRADNPDWVGTLDVDGFPAGSVPNYLAEFVDVPFCLARGWWRAPLHTFAAFATESFVDEVAHALKRDPLALRLQLLGEPRELQYREHGGPVFHTGRLAATLREAAKQIGYGRPLPRGHGIGFASHFTFGGYTSHAMEVAAKPGGGWHFVRCVCVSDVGIVVNPLGVEAQLMGGTVDGISTALGLEITVEQGRVQQTNFHEYRLLRIPDAPAVEVHILRTNYPPCGAGEMGVPSALPALANAIYAATGQRLRRLPLLSPQLPPTPA